MRPTVRWMLVAAGLALLIGVPLGWALLQPAAQVGALPSDGAAASSVPDAGAEPRPGPSGTDGSVAGSGTDAATAPAADIARTRPSVPVAISLPSIGITQATVVEVGLDDDGAVDIPDDVREVGWYGLGPRPGEAGNAFLTSHVDSRTQGRGVLFGLRHLQPGDRIEVEHADGTVSSWEVVARERVEKGAYPFERVFRFDGPPGLVIDTCGGRFDPATGSYRSIDIVYAVPAGGDLLP